MLGLFGPKSGKIGVYKAAFIYQGPLKEDFSAGSPAINEVVLEGEFCGVRLDRVLGSSALPHSPATRGCASFPQLCFTSPSAKSLGSPKGPIPPTQAVSTMRFTINGPLLK